MILSQVLDGIFDPKCDCWAMGVMTFILLSGCPPFDGNSEADIIRAVRRAEVSFQDQESWSGVSAAAQDFIRRLLVTDLNKRPTAEEALQHPWLALTAPSTAAAADGDGGASNTEASLADRPPSRGELNRVIANLKAFRDFSALKRLALEVVAFSLAPHQVRALQRDFEAFDQGHKGSWAFYQGFVFSQVDWLCLAWLRLTIWACCARTLMAGRR